MVKRKDVVWDALEDIEEQYGLKHEFDSVHVQDMPEGTPAMTQHDIHGSGTGDTHLVVDRYLDQYADNSLETVLVHEILHSNQFNGDFGEKFQSQYGISDDLKDRLNEVMRKGDRDEIEGMTQALTNKIVENGEITGRYFYPYETQEFERELAEEGIDLDEEFDRETYASILEEKDIYGLEGRMEIGENFLYHQMTVGDTDYELMVFGEEADEYLDTIEEKYGLEDLENIYEDLDPDDDDGFYFDAYGDVGYGESENSVGNIDVPHEVPDSASMGTGTNGMPESHSRFGA